MNFKTVSAPTQRKRSLQPPIVRPRTAHLPKRAGAREARGARGGPNRVTTRRNRRAAPARVGSTPFRRKKKEHAAQALGTFPTYRGAFRPSPPSVAVPLAAARSEVGETGGKSLAHTRALHRVSVFCLHPPAVIQCSTMR